MRRKKCRGDAIEARPLSLTERIARRVWQHKGKVAAAAVALVLLLSMAWLAYDRAVESRRRRVAEYDKAVVDAVAKLQASGAFVDGTVAASLHGEGEGDAPPRGRRS